MSIKVQDFTNSLEAVLTGAMTTKDDLDELIKAAQNYHFCAMLGPRCFNAYFSRALEGSGVIPVSGCCFPAGHDPSEVKAFHAKYAVNEGIKEIDMVMNLPYFKSKMYNLVIEDIKMVKTAIGENIPLKCIIEAPLLKDDEIKLACELLYEGGADYVKSATGLQGVTTLHHVEVIAKAAENKLRIKIAGGIRTPEDVENILDYGVDRLGVSYKNAAKIIEELL